MKKLVVFCLGLGLVVNVWGQDNSQKKDDNWKFKAVGGINGTHASFKNWNSGGQNTLSWITLFDGEANWKKDKLRWENGMNLAYGQNRIIRQNWGKTDDAMSIYSKFGYSFYKTLDIALFADFKTQFDVSRSTDGLEDILSKFMAPGYLTIALGADYHPTKNLQIMFSPITGKITYVKDFTLSHAGAFGVESGETVRSEFGSFMKLLYNDEIMENVTFKGRLELFSNYFNNPQNIDINAEVLFDFKINKWLSASWSSTVIYDDDIKIQRTNDDGSNLGLPVALAQIKNILSLGIRYTFVDK